MTLWDKLLNRGEAVVNEFGGTADQFAGGIRQGLQLSKARETAFDLIQAYTQLESPHEHTPAQAESLAALYKEISLAATSFHSFPGGISESPPTTRWANAPSHVQTSVGAFVEGLRRRPELREGLHLLAASSSQVAPKAQQLELHLEKLARIQHHSNTGVEQRVERRNSLRRAFIEQIEESDYAELDGSSLLREVGGVISLDRAAVHAAYDVQHLQEQIRRHPRSALPYIELAEAHQAMARAEAVRAGIRGVISPWSLLTRGAVEVHRKWRDLPRQEIQLARHAVVLAAARLRTEPRHIDALVAAGRAHLLLGDARKSAQLLKAALVLKPQNRVLYFHLTRTYAVAEQPKTALKYAVMGSKLGCPRCLALLDDSLRGMKTADARAPGFAADVRDRRMREEQKETEAVPARGILDQVMEEKRRSLRAVALRAERFLDEWGGAARDR